MQTNTPAPTTPGQGNTGAPRAAPPQTPSVIVAPPPPPPRKPNKPQTGTVEETSSGHYVFAFGGKPNANFTDLEDPSTRKLRSTMYRPLDPTLDGKGGKIREKGLETQLKDKGDITTFRRDVWEHLQKHGLDTITYLNHPLDPTKVESVVTHYALFSSDLANTSQIAKTIEANFDSWDVKNDASAKDFLKASIDPDFYNDMYLTLDPDDGFAMTWIRIMQYMVSTSADRFTDMKAKLKVIRPQNYAGQNITTMANDYLRLAKELDNAGVYDHELTQHMVEGCLHATTADKMGRFNYTLQKLNEEVEDAIRHSKFMSRMDADAYFAKKDLHYRQVLRKINLVYRTLKDANKWEPAKLPKDRTALTLVHQSSSAKSKSSSKPRFHNNKKHGKFKPGRDKTGWRFQAPKDSEPTTKQVNGETYHWCTKCFGTGFWTKSHTDATHTGSTSKASSTKQSASTNIAVVDPCFWTCTLYPSKVPVTTPSAVPTAVPVPTKSSAYSILSILLGISGYIAFFILGLHHLGLIQPFG